MMIDDLTNLTTRRKVGQLFTIGIPGPEVDADTRELLLNIVPGGICLFSRNVREAEQTRKLLDDLRVIVPDEPMLSLDQEGGTVDRLRRVVTPIAAAATVKTVDEAAEMARIIAQTIALLGFNIDFAPVVDVVGDTRSGSSNGLFTRPWGKSKEDVVALAGRFFSVLQENGQIGCLKHFPGLGGAGVDAHEELPVVDISKEELFEVDLFPYRELLRTGNIHIVMVAHACFPNIDLQERDQNGKLLPSSLSKNFVTKLLRDELGFDGLVITDDLEMGAIVKNYGMGEACVMAVEAGVDMLAICAEPRNIIEGFQAVLAAVDSGRINEDRLDRSMRRIAAVKSRQTHPPPLDLARLSALSDEIAGFNARLENN